MRRMLLAAALGLMGVCGALAAQEPNTAYLRQLPPLIDRELFFGDPEISGAQISPDGRFVSFRRQYKQVLNIWVKRIDEPFDAARPITADTTRPVRGYFWSRDGRYVLYVQDKGGNENYHVYAVDPGAEADAETGVPPALDLTPYENVRAQIYAVPKGTPNTIIVGLNERDPQVHDVYRIDLRSGERELILQNDENVAGWQTDLSGTVRLGLRVGSDGSTEILRLDGEELIEVYRCSNEESCGPIRFHKDAKRVYMITNKGTIDLAQLMLFDLETGEEELVESDPENEVDFGGAAFSEVTDELLATVYVGDRVRIYPKNDDFAHDLAVLRQKLPEGELSFGSATQDERLAVVVVSRDVDPGSVYLYNRDTEAVELLYHSRPKLPSEHLATMNAIRYRARDGLEIPAYLTLPKGVEPSNLPVVIHPHGGPWGRDTWGYDSYAQFLANRGYAVLQPNFRGSAGFGKAFLHAGDKEWGTGAMQHDITDGVSYLIEEGIADPERVAIFGGSYGGYATLAGVAFTPDVYAAGISYVGPSSIITLLNSIPPYWEPIKKIFHVRVGDPDDPEDRERLIAQSPLYSADRITAPLLVIQGANDPRVNKAESEQIVVALRDLGRDVEYMLAPDEGHGFSGEENRLAIAVAMEQFFANHLGGRNQEEMRDEIATKLAALTVDVATVVLPEAPVAAADAETAPLPVGDGSIITAGTLQYRSTLQVRGQEMAIDVTRAIEPATSEGRAVWRIIDVSQSPMGGGVDTVEINKSTLMPMRRSASGGATVQLQYAREAITGEIGARGQTMPINIELPAPTFGEGAALDVAIAALPLAEGYETTFRTFAVLTQKVRLMMLTVTGTETVDCPAGTFETFVLKITSLDGDEGGTGTMHVMRSAPHYLVRATAKLPAMMGGGTVTSELASIAPSGSN